MGPGRLRELLYALGLERLFDETEAEELDDDGPDATAVELLERREAARVARDFEQADRLREELAALGYEVRDTPDGARLVRTE